MNIKTLLSSIVLLTLPGLAFAGGCGGLHMDTHAASSCQVGQVWDETIQDCVDSVSS